MATRSLTEVFILMRNNALQSRHIFSEQTADDRTSLMSSVHLDPELGMVSMRGSGSLPPEWIDKLTETQFEFTKIKEKMKELSVLHDKHLNRPTMDDTMDEEHEIEILTQQITQMFSRCQRVVQQINSQSLRGTNHEQKLTHNIVASLARTMQEMSTTFRKSQSAYLRKVKSREERSQQYFGTHLDANLMSDGMSNDEDFLYEKGFTSAQMQLVDNNTEFVQQREKEVASIVRSITDLNEIFKDLASMIVDQGTILDRIDYNIDNAATYTEKGLVQLKKAEKYQKKNRKMMCVLILCAIIIVLLIILIAVKS